MRPSCEHPTHIGKSEPLSKAERLTFGDSARCAATGRVFECGSGALSHVEQSALFVAEAELGRALSPLEAQLTLQKVRAQK
jgi:hypothetical protein